MKMKGLFKCFSENRCKAREASDVIGCMPIT